MYRVVITKEALKVLPRLKAAGLSKKAKALVELLAVNPFQNPPAYEKLVGDLQGMYSRRINIQHRLVYRVDEENKLVKVLSMWSHYEYC
jgi:toxin YoeB